MLKALEKDVCVGQLLAEMLKTSQVKVYLIYVHHEVRKERPEAFTH